jgi:hypothetical protein
VAIVLQFGHSPRVPSGQRRGSGVRQLGQIPIIPFSAQLATGLALQFGHFPLVPSGQKRTMFLQFGHLPVVPSGQCRTMLLQLGHLPLVPWGHLRDPVLTQFGQIPFVPLGQTLGIFCGMTRRPPESADGSVRTCPRGFRCAASAEDTATSPASNNKKKRIVAITARGALL